MKLCNLDTAQALQELGYDGEYTYCHAQLYGVYELMHINDCEKSRKEISSLCAAPRLDDAAYFIRDKYGLNIRISYIMLNECWFYDMLHLETNRYYDGDDWLYSDYDSALEAAVTKAIEIIKEKKL